MIFFIVRPPNPSLSSNCLTMPRMPLISPSSALKRFSVSCFSLIAGFKAARSSSPLAFRSLLGSYALIISSASFTNFPTSGRRSALSVASTVSPAKVTPRCSGYCVDGLLSPPPRLLRLRIGCPLLEMVAIPVLMCRWLSTTLPSLQLPPCLLV